jgi:hypothetical protein
LKLKCDGCFQTLLSNIKLRGPSSEAIDIVAFLKWIYSVQFFRVWYMGGAMHQAASPNPRFTHLTLRLLSALETKM